MTYTINDTETENMGSVQVAFIEIDITSYDASGGSGPEDVSGDALGLPTDPVYLTAISDANNHAFTWDKAGDTLTVHDGASEVADSTTVGDVQLMAVYRGL